MEEVVKTKTEKETTRSGMVETIKFIVLKHSPGVTMEALESASRTREVVQARQTVMKLAHESKYTNFSLASIGRMVAKRDHATVLHSNKTIENLRDTDKRFNMLYSVMEEEVNKALRWYGSTQKFVLIVSPYRGNVESNTKYARLALKDSISRNEVPIASHLLYTQILDDNNERERNIGIELEADFLRIVDIVAVYTDNNISSGMNNIINKAVEMGVSVDFRQVKK